MPKTTLAWNPEEYATVRERVEAFRLAYPTGRIVTELVSRTRTRVTFRALVYRSTAEPDPAATGWASEREGDGEINQASCLENAETSAVGRALANLGFSASRAAARGAEVTGAAHTRSVARLVREGAADAHDDAGRRAAFDARQRHADAVKDAQAAVRAAERAGLPPAEATRHMRVLTGRSVPPSEITRIERALRAWLDERFSRPAPEVPPSVDDTSDTTL